MRKFVVRVPIEVTVCVEVRAKNQTDALWEANAVLTEVTPLYEGIGSNLDRATMLGVHPNEGSEAWFETDDTPCEFFLGDRVKVTRK